MNQLTVAAATVVAFLVGGLSCSSSAVGTPTSGANPIAAGQAIVVAAASEATRAGPSAGAIAPAASTAPLGALQARALLTRVAFAPSETEVARFAGLSQAQAVDQLLVANDILAVPPPTWTAEAITGPKALRQMSQDERRDWQRLNRERTQELRGWWLAQMAATEAPLAERMTLFWHNHFVVAAPKVRSAQLLYQDNALLRRHALGNFGTLLHAVAKDPAMLIYLDGAANRKKAPNENFAREVMELFTVGEGNYGEADIKEAARAFTGWSVDPDTAGFVVRTALHDGGEKTLFGRTGRFDGDQVLDVLLAQPATARFVVGKLWREFVSPQPDAARIEPIAARFRASGYDVRGVLRELLNQPEVVARAPETALVKSPVELVVGLVRQSGATFDAPRVAAFATAVMGQNLFGAPNVRGWPGGEAWITTQSLLARKQFVERVTATRPAAMVMPVAAQEGTDTAAGMQTSAAVSTQLISSADATDTKAGAARRASRVVAVPKQLASPARVEAALAINPLRIDVDRWLGSTGTGSGERPLDAANLARLASAVLVTEPAAAHEAPLLARDALRGLLLDPAYQLK